MQHVQRPPLPQQHMRDLRVRAGPAASGTHYVSAVAPRAHTQCYMTLAISDVMPSSPSLVGADIQRYTPHSNDDGDKTCAQRQHEAAVQHALQCIARSRGAANATTPPPQLLELQYELFDTDAPQACDNFRQLCSGHGRPQLPLMHSYAPVRLCYRGTYFHKVIPDLCAQAGDVTLRVDGGSNYMHSAGRGWLDDESKRRRINEAGLLCMANNGPDSNGTQFFITTSATQESMLNGRYVCFGRVTHGLDNFLRAVAPYGNDTGMPLRYVVIVDCGVGATPTQRT